MVSIPHLPAISCNNITTEACVFDFKDWLIVEFFRGTGSEILIFYKILELDQKLFGSNELSISDIRCLIDDIHDHVYCWQNSYVNLLMKKEIYPNEKIINFKITSKFQQIYNRQTGLPPLSYEKVQPEQALEKWRMRQNCRR